MEKFFQVPDPDDFTYFLMNLDVPTKNKKMLIHRNLLSQLLQTCDIKDFEENEYTLIWKATDIYCQRTIKCLPSDIDEWYLITYLDIVRVEFTPPSSSLTDSIYFK